MRFSSHHLFSDREIGDHRDRRRRLDHRDRLAGGRGRTRRCDVPANCAAALGAARSHPFRPGLWYLDTSQRERYADENEAEQLAVLAMHAAR